MSASSDRKALLIIQAGNALPAATENDLEKRGLIKQSHLPYATLTQAGLLLINAGQVDSTASSLSEYLANDEVGEHRASQGAHKVVVSRRPLTLAEALRAQANEIAFPSPDYPHKWQMGTAKDKAEQAARKDKP